MLDVRRFLHHEEDLEGKSRMIYVTRVEPAEELLSLQLSDHIVDPLSSLPVLAIVLTDFNRVGHLIETLGSIASGTNRNRLLRIRINRSWAGFASLQ
jgi:hypothetical protein